MPSSSLPRHRRALVALAAMSLAVTLAACTDKEGEDPTPTPAPQSTSAEAVAEESTSETSKQPGWRRRSDDPELVAEVAEQFSSLAPAELFDALDTCSETSLKGSVECSGSEVGKFQFFESESMAEDTKDLLTGLRSSRIVEESEDGNKIVGWSMLGRTAVLTVVDSEKGQLLQQMVDSEDVDPEQRIYELGLAEDDGTGVKTPEPATDDEGAEDQDGEQEAKQLTNEQ